MGAFIGGTRVKNEEEGRFGGEGREEEGWRKGINGGGGSSKKNALLYGWFGGRKKGFRKAEVFAFFFFLKFFLSD